MFWQWDEQRITQLVRACIRLGVHPGIWKTAKGVVIPKPWKTDYSRVRAYRVISLLDVISKLLERTAGHLIADHLERSRGLHEGQFGYRRRRSCVDAVAILMNRTQKAWAGRKVAGALFMDVKSAFNNVDKTLLGKRMEKLGVEADLIRWTMSFMTDRRVKLVLDGETGESHPVDTGVPQGSPAAPILFVTYLSGIFEAVEKAVTGVSGLSFVDDIGWWAEGCDEEAVAAKLSEAKIRVGDSEVPFNNQATRWLGVWLDSHLKLRHHHEVRMNEGKKALARLQRLTGKMGLSPANCRRVMTACVQSTAMYGAELWWKGEGGGTDGRAKELQVLINREARATTGCFRTTNQGALAMESGLRPAVNQLENRQRRFGLRLLRLPQGDKARDIVGAQTAIGKRLGTTLSYTWTETEKTVLLEVPVALDATTVQEEREEAKREAEKERPGLVMFTDGSRLENEAAGYAVAWRSGRAWEGIKAHMGYNQEAYDAECAAIARALETAAKRVPAPTHVALFTDAQAAIRKMSTDEPGPGQKYALEARQHIAALRATVPGISIEVRWCPAHEGVEGNEQADRWAKLAADEPDTPGVEWPDEARPRSLANIKREISEKKWAEARQWAGSRTSKKKYSMPMSQKPDGTMVGSQAAGCQVLPAEDGALPHGRIPALDDSPSDTPVLVVPAPQADEGASLEGMPEVAKAAESAVEGGVEGDREGEGEAEGSRALWRTRGQPGGFGVPFLDGGREDSAVGGSGGGRGRRQRGVGVGAPREGGAGRGEEGGGPRCRGRRGGGARAVPSHPVVHGVGRSGVGGGHVFPFFFPFVSFLGAHRSSLGTGLGGGQGECLHGAASRGLRLGNGLYIDTRHDLPRSHTSIMNKKKKPRILQGRTQQPIFAILGIAWRR